MLKIQRLESFAVEKFDFNENVIFQKMNFKKFVFFQFQLGIAKKEHQEHGALDRSLSDLKLSKWWRSLHPNAAPDVCVAATTRRFFHRTSPPVVGFFSSGRLGCLFEFRENLSWCWFLLKIWIKRYEENNFVFFNYFLSREKYKNIRIKSVKKRTCAWRYAKNFVRKKTSLNFSRYEEKFAPKKATFQ